MLGKIWEVLYRNTDLEEEGLKKLSEQVLQTIEDNGMLPPTYTFNAGKPHILNGDDVNEWEEE